MLARLLSLVAPFVLGLAACSAPKAQTPSYRDTGSGNAPDRVTTGMLPPTKTEDIPQGLLPSPGVVLVGDDEFDARVADGETVVNINQVASENAARAVETDRIIQDAALANPEAAAVLTAPTEGEVLHDVGGHKVMLLNDYARKEMLRAAIEQSAKAEVTDYAVIYDAAPDDTKAALTAPASVSVTKGVIASAASMVIQRYKPAVQAQPDIPSGRVEQWEDEIGVGFLGDHDSPRRAQCGGFSNQGIMSNFDFPLKYRLTSVKDQGDRGTCGSFALSSVAESQIATNQNKWVNYSEQDLYFQIRGPWVANVGFYGDGTNLALALPTMFLTGYRFAYERDWDYNASRGRTEKPLAKSCTSYAGERCSDTYHQGKEICSVWEFWNCFLPEGVDIPARSNAHVTGFRILGLPVLGYAMDSMKAALAARQGVIFSFDVTPSFDRPTDGFVTFTKSETRRGGHVVHLVGFVSNEDLQKKLPSAPAGSGGGYFIVKNSWGECWADGGFVYVPVDFVKEYGTGVVVVSSVGS